MCLCFVLFLPQLRALFKGMEKTNQMQYKKGASDSSAVTYCRVRSRGRRYLFAF